MHDDKDNDNRQETYGEFNGADVLIAQEGYAGREARNRRGAGDKQGKTAENLAGAHCGDKGVGEL